MATPEISISQLIEQQKQLISVLQSEAQGAQGGEVIRNTVEGLTGAIEGLKSLRAIKRAEEVE
ncbi:hypothetical protein H6G00_00970 [Leptolyngbya sp. FACHB-541]|uniref:hypothetical protein n=1 Tax=Leptolyngbya sp. FACHB-541 TaxID=2692810 RepID=UPI0016876CFA|nr:hypothetical protein [Leptolyngbya sp. FACHB-541]MBD1995200.1 hypothetical protein [Leptolyngbya sp. FACHB-541]